MKEEKQFFLWSQQTKKPAFYTDKIYFFEGVFVLRIPFSFVGCSRRQLGDMHTCGNDGDGRVAAVQFTSSLDCAAHVVRGASYSTKAEKCEPQSYTKHFGFAHYNTKATVAGAPPPLSNRPPAGDQTHS